MARKKKQSRPYVMRGPARPTAARPTIADPPDRRMPPNPVTTLTAEQIRGIELEDATDPRLRTIERFFHRWAITRGDGQFWPTMARSAPFFRTAHDKPPPLDDAESRIVDAAVRTAPEWAKRFVKLWYRQALSVQEMQENLAIRRRQGVYEERRLVLAYFLGRLAHAGLSVPSRKDVGDP